VNGSPVQSQCYVRLPFADLGGRRWRFDDAIGGATYEREGDDLQSRGLYLDELGWKASVLAIRYDW
jgi:hypothetical protein